MWKSFRHINVDYFLTTLVFATQKYTLFNIDIGGGGEDIEVQTTLHLANTRSSCLSDTIIHEEKTKEICGTHLINICKSDKDFVFSSTLQWNINVFTLMEISQVSKCEQPIFICLQLLAFRVSKSNTNRPLKCMSSALVLSHCYPFI